MLTDTNVLICIEDNIQMRSNEDLQKQENQEKNKNFSTLIQSDAESPSCCCCQAGFLQHHPHFHGKQAFTAEAGSAAYEQDVI